MKKEMTEEQMREELEKCKASPYYFYTTYFQVNGQPATTRLSEEEFNREFFGNKATQLSRTIRRWNRQMREMPPVFTPSKIIHP